VEEYYSVLPDDPETGYSLLSPDYQSSTSFEDYEAFWSTIDAVTVEDTRPAGSDAVDVALVYATGDGTKREVRRIFVERGDDGYRVSADQIVG
jgi:hypothetical protein